MVRPPSFDMNGIKSGVWSKEEDDRLRAFVQKHGHHNWQKLPSLAGLARSGKSCRLRWMNYLQPGLKKGNFTKEEVSLIIKLHNQIGNRWSAIAEKLPGRTDNDIKNHWHAHIKKRSRFVTRDEEQSFDQMNFCKESSDEEQNAVENSVNVGGFRAEEYDDRLMFNDLGLLAYNIFNIEEEFCTLGLLHNHIYSPTFSDSSLSDSGSRITCQLDMDIPQEEFCDYHTPTFYDSSEPEINIPPQDFSVLGAEDSTLNNHTQVFIGFNHLERAWYFGDDDVSCMNMHSA